MFQFENPHGHVASGKLRSEVGFEPWTTRCNGCDKKLRGQQWPRAPYVYLVLHQFPSNEQVIRPTSPLPQKAVNHNLHFIFINYSTKNAGCFQLISASMCNYYTINYVKYGAW